MALELQTDVAMYLRPRLQASNERIIDLWLSRKAEKTQKAYLRDIGQFLDFVGYKHVNEITLPDIVDFLNDLDHLAESTQARKIAAIKSLLAFAYKAGFTVVNVGAAVESISVPNELTDRILTETEVFRMIEYTKKPRDKALIRFLYSTAVRVEKAHFRWSAHSQGQGRQKPIPKAHRGNDGSIGKHQAKGLRA
jgi:integrase/recombinase XerD